MKTTIALATVLASIAATGIARAADSGSADPYAVFRDGTSAMHADAVMAGGDPGRLKAFLSRYPSSPLAGQVAEALSELGEEVPKTPRTAPARSLRDLGVGDDPA